MPTHCTIHTPWGPSQQVRHLAPGIDRIDTAGHGGIRLSAERALYARMQLPDWTPFAGWPWLEEDSDMGVAYLLWPECFTAKQVHAALMMVSGYRDGYFDGVKRWLRSESPATGATMLKAAGHMVAV